MNFRISTYSFIGLFVIVLLYSCSSKDETEEQKNVDSVVTKASELNSSLQPPIVNTQVLSVQTFEVVDASTNKAIGWGYDILMDGKATIHQPNIPAVPGNQVFPTKEMADKLGNFAINKMKQTGGLPTITLKELDSLGVKYIGLTK